MKTTATVLLASLFLLTSLSVTADTREERQARSIQILKAGILSRPAVSPMPAPAVDYFIEASEPELASEEDTIEIVVLVESSSPSNYYGPDYDPYWDSGHAHGYHHRRPAVPPPVVSHTSRASGITYAPENSPHRDSSTATFNRSWRR